MFDTQAILILIALASAIVGTIWNARTWGKVAIIILAIATAGTAIHESQKKATAETNARVEAKAARRNLDLIVRAIQPPAIFDQAVLAAFRSNAERIGMFVSGQTISENGSRVFEFLRTKDESNLAGLIYLDVADRQRLFVSFAQEKDLIPPIKEFISGAQKAPDLSGDWNAYVLMTFNLAKHALGNLLPFEGEYTGHFDASAQTVKIDIRGPNGQPVGDIIFDQKFMKSLVSVPPIERGRLVSEHTAAQVIQ